MNQNIDNNKQYSDKIKLLEKENAELKKQLEDRDSSDCFLNILAEYVNKGFFNLLQIQDGMFGVVKVDWNNMVMRNGIEEPFMSFIGYHPSNQLDLAKILNVSTLVGVESPEHDTLRKVIKKAMKSTTGSSQSDFIQESVPASAFGIAFLSTAIAIRNKSGQVIGGFGIATHFDLFKEISPILAKMKDLSYQIQHNKTADFKQEFNAQVSELSKTIASLSLGITSVKDALSQLTYIAEKTKVLSFNASIESARAGVHGKGFAVVSGEIRKLSDQSRGAIENVNQIISNTVHLIQEITNTEANFTSALNNLQDELKHLDDIVNTMDTNINDLSNINQKIENQFKVK